MEIDLVHTPRGVSPDEIATRAIQLASVRVMHPIHVLMSRAANVVHIPRTDQHSLKQLRAAVFVVREFVRETLRETAVRPALRLNEWAFEAAMSDDSLCVWRAYGVDFFDAVLIASELGEDFAKIRFPQMSARLLDRRNA